MDQNECDGRWLSCLASQPVIFDFHKLSFVLELEFQGTTYHLKSFFFVEFEHSNCFTVDHVVLES